MGDAFLEVVLIRTCIFHGHDQKSSRRDRSTGEPSRRWDVIHPCSDWPAQTAHTARGCQGWPETGTRRRAAERRGEKTADDGGRLRTRLRTNRISGETILLPWAPWKAERSTAPFYARGRGRLRECSTGLASQISPLTFVSSSPSRLQPGVCRKNRTTQWPGRRLLCCIPPSTRCTCPRSSLMGPE